VRARFLSIIGLGLILCAQYVVADHGTASAERSDASQQATQLWAQALAAKGGRERLHAVRSIAVTARGGDKTQVRTEELLVLPNKYWLWTDLRPAAFGLRVEMFNYDTNTHYLITPHAPHASPQPIKGQQRNESLRNTQLSFLLESRWLKPTPLQTRPGTVGARPVDIVQTDVAGARVDFALDRETHLPLAVSYYNVYNGRTFITTFEFSDYAEVDGIKVPRRIKFSDGTEAEINVRFNVAYDEAIFAQPPPLKAGPEAWRRQAAHVRL
jgi:hypothetical protein